MSTYCFVLFRWIFEPNDKYGKIDFFMLDIDIFHHIVMICDISHNFIRPFKSSFNLKLLSVWNFLHLQSHYLALLAVLRFLHSVLLMDGNALMVMNNRPVFFFIFLPIFWNFFSSGSIRFMCWYRRVFIGKMWCEYRLYKHRWWLWMCLPSKSYLEIRVRRTLDKGTAHKIN